MTTGTRHSGHYHLRGLALVAAATGCAVALAVPAWADELNGVYSVAWDDGENTTWTFTPCGEGCVHVTSNKGGWSTNGHLANGTWTLDQYQSNFTCKNGPSLPQTNNVTIDAATLSGTSVVKYQTACPGDPPGPGSATVHMKLTKAG
jgi:hypothetical protein